MTISPSPQMSSTRGRVRKKTGSMKTARGRRMLPKRFLTPQKSIAVFPPMQASTSHIKARGEPAQIAHDAAPEGDENSVAIAALFRHFGEKGKKRLSVFVSLTRGHGIANFRVKGFFEPLAIEAGDDLVGEEKDVAAELSDEGFRIEP